MPNINATCTDLGPKCMQLLVCPQHVARSHQTCLEPSDMPGVIMSESSDMSGICVHLQNFGILDRMYVVYWQLLAIFSFLSGFSASMVITLGLEYFTYTHKLSSHCETITHKT